MTDDRYFSERESGEPGRDEQGIGGAFWGGFVALIERLIAHGYFAESFPEECEDGGWFTAPGSSRAMRLAFSAEIGGIGWPFNADTVPETPEVLDAVQFFARHVSKPGTRSWHQYFRHDDIHSFDKVSGVSEYREQVNRLFRRCRHPYEITAERVQRMSSPVLQEALVGVAFGTGDDELDRLLWVAREKFLDPDPEMRAEAIEKLWDGWERLKTLVLPDDKRESLRQLLDQVAPEPRFREVVETDAGVLTSIGNDFMIRHTEVTKPKIQRLEHLDYLFHRLFALIYMILKTRGGVG